MSRFVFSCAQGRFPIPNGESRVGSDSSCPVCIQGEGVMPVHAYLKVDGEKLLIRPSSEKSQILVEGKPIGGPQPLQIGQSVGIGPLKMKLEADGAAPSAPLMKRRWFRVVLWSVGGIAALLLLGVLARYAYFNDAWFKAQIVRQVDAALQREDTEIDLCEVDLWNGNLKLMGLKVPMREASVANENHLLKVDRVDGRIDSWALARSWLAGLMEIRASQLKLTRPQLYVERVLRNGKPVSNIDDIIARYTEGPPRAYPIDLGLGALETDLTIDHGSIRVRDEYTGLGLSSLEEIALHVAQHGFGEKLKFSLAARAEAPGRSSGNFRLDGEFLAVNEAGMIDLRDVGKGKAQLNLQGFDLARFFSHLQWDLAVNGGNQRIVPGKPITGAFTVTFQDLQNFRLEGEAESESLVSVIEGNLPPIGNIPTWLDVEMNYETARGPADVNFSLRSARSLKDAKDARREHILTLTAAGRRDPEGNFDYKVDLGANLEGLFATDVGARLNLKDRLRGRLTGDARLKLAGDKMILETALAQNGEAYVPHPADPRAPGQWVATNVKADCQATAVLKDGGRPTEVEARFTAVADSGSFEIHSRTPARIENLDQDDKLRINTQFELNLEGQKFYKEFQTYLNLAGFSDAWFQENLKANMTVYSGPQGEDGEGLRKISLSLDGQALPQWKENPTPLELLAIVDYYPELAVPDAPAGSPPYLKLTLQTGSETSAPFVRAENVELRRTGSRQTLSLPVKTESDLLALQDRFEPYITRFLKALDEREAELTAVHGTPVSYEKLYREFTLKGELKQACRLELSWDTAPREDGSKEMRVAFDATLSGKHLAIAGPAPRAAAPAEGQTPARFTWMEPEPVFTVKGSYRSRPSASREKPDLRVLDLESLKMKGTLGDFQMNARDVDLWLLDQLSRKDVRLRDKVAPDAVREGSFDGAIQPAGFDLLRRLGVMPSEPAVQGRLKLQAHYRREGDKLSLKEFIFENAEHKADFWLHGLDAVANIRNVRQFFGDRAGRPLAAFLEHLDEHLVVKLLALDGDAFTRWVFLQPDAAKALGLPDELIDMIRGKTLNLDGSWSVTDLAFRPVPNKERSWNLVGQFRNDLRCVLSGMRGRPPILLTFQGPWSIREEDASALTFSKDYSNPTVQFSANFDATAIVCDHIAPNWNYRKPAGQPLSFTANGSWSPGQHGKDTIYSVEAIGLRGGPLSFMLNGVDARTNRDPKDPLAEHVKLFTLRQAVFAGGPMNWDARNPCTAERLKYEAEEDKLRVLVKAPHLDLNYLWNEKLIPYQLPPPPGVPPDHASQPVLYQSLRDYLGLSGEGTVTDIQAEFNGSLARLTEGRLDPFKDSLSVRLKHDTVFTTLRNPEHQAKLSAKGEWAVGNTEIQAAKLDLVLRGTRKAKGEEARTTVHAVHADGLWIASSNEKLNAIEALRADPRPLALKLPLRFTTTFDQDAFDADLDALFRSLAPEPSVQKPGSPRFADLARINAEGSLSAPRYVSGTTALDKLEIPKFNLKDLKLGVPLLTAFESDGALTVSTFNADLSTATVEHPQHIKFEPFTIKLLRADLRKLTKDAGADGGYKAEGLVSLEGVLAGAGLADHDLKTWHGDFEVPLESLVVHLPVGKQSGGAIQKVGAGLGILEGIAGKVGLDKTKLLNQRFFGFVNTDAKTQMFGQQLSKLPVLGSAGFQRGLLTSLYAADLYLSAFGLETDRIDFKPAKILVRIQNGIADIRTAPDGKLSGKGKAEGLIVDLRGKIRLWDEGFEGPFKVWVAGLPPASKQKLALDLWPPEHRAAFLKDLEDGELALTLTGTLAEPKTSYPDDKIKRYGMLAVFGQERFTDGTSVEQGLNHLRAGRFGQSEAGKDAAAALLHGVGVALPNTAAHQGMGSSLLDRVAGLSGMLNQQAQPSGRTLTPGESLREMLKPPPPPPPPDPNAPKSGTPKQPEAAPKTTERKPSLLDIPFDILDDLRVKGAKD